MTCDPGIIEVVHVHCHFDKTAEARVAAIELLDSCASALESAGCPVLHTHVWDRKNGPHIGWSWELWIEQGLAVGVAVSHPHTLQHGPCSHSRSESRLRTLQHVSQ